MNLYGSSEAKIQGKGRNYKSEMMSSSNPYSTLIPINDESISNLIFSLCNGDDQSLQAWDFMEIKGIGERQAARYASTEQSLLGDAVLFAKIVKLTALRGDQRLLQLMLPDGLSIVPCENKDTTNGSVDDEIAREVVDLGQIKVHFEAGNKKKALEVLQEAKLELGRIEKEILK